MMTNLQRNHRSIWHRDRHFQQGELQGSHHRQPPGGSRSAG
jgi:hypothetical protein